MLLALCLTQLSPQVPSLIFKSVAMLAFISYLELKTWDPCEVVSPNFHALNNWCCTYWSQVTWDVGLGIPCEPTRSLGLRLGPLATTHGHSHCLSLVCWNGHACMYVCAYHQPYACMCPTNGASWPENGALDLPLVMFDRHVLFFLIWIKLLMPW